MNTPDLAAENVVATFENMDDARHAISLLERHGVDAVHISLSGPSAVEAEYATTQLDTLNTHDANVAGYLGRRTIYAACVTAGALGIIGFIVGSFIRRPTSVALAVGGLTIGIFVGIMLGFFFGGVMALPMSKDWELTFQSVADGPVRVGVHSDDARLVRIATGLLRLEDPAKIDHLDAQGRSFAA